MITAAGAKKALARRIRAKSAAPTFMVQDYLFPKQAAFVLDPSPNKVAVCSRRSGKTTACAADLVAIASQNEGVVCLYITLSRNNAKKILWPELKKINRVYKLDGILNLSELSITFPNNSVIYLSGAKDASEIEKFRGMAIKLCYIDECQSFRVFIKELIDDVLAPALMDYAGTLCLIGTPGPTPSGYFYACAEEGSTWSKHAWSFWDNPFIVEKSKSTHQQMIDRELTRRGVLISDASVQREWFGRWVLDSDSLLLHYKKEVNHYDTLPLGKYNYIMGIDLGYEDADAIAVLAWNDDSPTTYLVEEMLVRKQGLTELSEQIQKLQKKYDISKMMIDEGGLGKKLAEEMRRRHGIPVEAADKVRKMENVAFLNDALRTGRFKAKATSSFAQDTFLVEIDRDKSTPDKIKVSNKYHSDIIDAVLYGFKESPTYSYQAAPKKPKVGTREWAEAQQSEMWDQAKEHFEKEAEMLADRRFNGFED